MSSKFGLVQFDDFSGGLDDTTPSTKLPITRAQTARNWNIVPGGALQKRNGSSKLNSSAVASGAPITHMDDFITSSGSKFLMGTAGTDLYKMDDMDGTWDALSLTLTSGQDVLPMSAKLNDLFVLVNNNESPKKFDGTTAADLGGSPPTGKMIIQVNNFLFIANHTSNKSRIQWSNLADPETWTGTDFLDIDPNDGDEIRAVGALFNNLYIFKRNAIHRMPIINSPFSRERIATKIGCVGHKAIVNVGGTHLFFMTADGRFITFDGSIITDVSSKRILNEIDSMNKNRLKFITMVDYQKRRQIWISYSSSAATQHDKILIYDYTNGITQGSWMIFTGIASDSMFAGIDQRSSSTEKEIMLTGDFSGFAREQDTGSANDDGGAIDAFWETGWNFFDAPQNIKIVRLAEILATEEGDHNLTFKVGFDFETDFQFSTQLSLAQTGAKWGTAIWGVDIWSGKSILQLPTILFGFGKAVKFGVQSRSAGEVLSLFRGFTVLAAQRGMRVQLAS